MQQKRAEKQKCMEGRDEKMEEREKERGGGKGKLSPLCLALIKQYS